MNSYKICLTILEFNTYLNLTILPNRRQTYAAQRNHANIELQQLPHK
jgi:hypothetical protein